MLSKESATHHFLSLTALKDNGGLVRVSDDVLKVLNMSERVFKQFVSGDDPHELKINSSPNLSRKLVNKIVYELAESPVFANLRQHDLENHCMDTDYHSTQIIKSVASKYLKIRLFRYGQTYTKDALQKTKLGERRQLNKLVHFQGL